MAKYKLAPENMIIDTDTGEWIPVNAAHRLYQKYLKWIADGNTPDPADPPPAPTQDELDAEAAKVYPKLVALKNMTPAEVQAWVDANVNTLADAKDAIKTLAVAVSIVAKRM